MEKNQQGKDKKAQENGQLEESSLHSDNNRSSSPTNQLDSIQNHDQDRAVSPQSQQSQQQARPSSASAKRRSRFLACFGAGHGSVDLLNSGTDESSAGGDSPRQACKEKPVVSRHILGDVVDSDGETRPSSPSPSSLSLNDSTGNELTTTTAAGKKSQQNSTSLNRNKRHVIIQSELVPDDYYIEKEPPLILNVEPKTYGKRLASSSAQTDSKLNVNGYLSTSTKKSKKSRGLLRGKRKNKTQMTIHCDVVQTQPQQQPTSKSKLSTQGDNSNQAIDSSLDQSVNGELVVENGRFKDVDDISIIQDVITSDDHKWRTCTIQTDSDSVTVNYVTIQSCGIEQNNVAASANGTVAPGTVQDDGYVSGSGDINRQSSFGKGLFSLSSSFGGTHDKQRVATELEKKSESESESKRARKQRAKSGSKSKDKAKKDSSLVSSVKKEQKSVSDDEQQHQSISISSVTVPKTESPEIENSTNEIAPISAHKASNDIQQDTSQKDESTRSISPTSKELKQKLKLERREKEKREKEEKKHQKELEEEAAKAEKLKKKQEKEAKKAEKLAQKLSKKSPPASVPQTPQPDESLSTVSGKTASVKFANTLVEEAPQESKDRHETLTDQHDTIKQLDSLQQGIENASSNYEREKERLSQEDGRDMIRVSISEKVEFDGNDEPAGELKTTTDIKQQSEKLISFSDSEDPSKSLEFTNQKQMSDIKEQTVQQPLKPILKQQSVSTSSAGGAEPEIEGEGEASAEIVISEDRKLASVASKLVSEATEEAVKVANEMKSLAEGELLSEKDDDLTNTTSNLSKKELEKLEKSRAKKEAKAKLEEEKRLAKEAKKLAKEAEATKKAEEAARKVEEVEAKKAAKKAKAEQEKLEKEAKIEQDRLAKEAKKQEKEAKKKLAKENKSTRKAINDSELSKSEEPASELSSDRPSKTVELSTNDASVVVVAEPPIKSEEPVMIDSQKKATTEETTAEKFDQVAKNIDDKKVETTEEESLVKQSEDLAGVVEDGTSISKGSDKKDKTKRMEDKVKKEKKLKESKVKQTKDEPSDSTEPLSSASKSSFFGRLFKKRSTSTKGLKGEDDEAAVSNEDNSIGKNENFKSKEKKKPMILSEMYPSDPDDADSEMILEVNVPKNLLINQQQQQKVESSQASDIAASPTLATTIDESLLTSEAHEHDEGLPVKSESVDNQTAVVSEDDQATLVNMSQMVTSEVGGDHDDDDATENVVSQANELTNQATVDDSIIDSSPVSIRVTSEAGKVIGEEEEGASQVNKGDSVAAVPAQPEVAVQQTIITEDVSKIADAEENVDKKEKKKDKQTKVKKSKAELKEEKDRKELEAKLEKEAKKRTKEEEKQKKREEKEAKLKAKVEEKQAKLEAKKREEEEKEKSKNEAKEAKRLEKLAKKQFKRDKKSSGKSSGDDKAQVAATSETPTTTGEKLCVSENEQQQKQVTPDDEVDTSNMTPVNTETEVQKIVEETVDEEGVVTRTTKTIETKYVTMQQEEFKTSEHREMPLEEYQRLKRSSDPAALEEGITSLEPQTTSSSKQVFEDVVDNKPSTSDSTQVVRLVNVKVEPYEHAELDEIRSTPSYFGPQIDLAKDLSEKKALKKRIKLNNKLIKRAYKLAKSESKKAKKQAKIAESEIAICDEAAKEAKKELKKALKEKKRATKVAAKEHKKMDKIDKILAKQQKKIEKRQRKLDKRAESLAKKELKKREKLQAKETKEAKALERKASQKSVASGSKKSIKLEDIGEPVLKSSSRLSIGAGGGGNIAGVGEGSVATEMVRGATSGDNKNDEATTLDKTVISDFSRASPESQRDGDLQVEMSLDYSNQRQQLDQSEDAPIHHSITKTTITETPDGQINKTIEEQVSTGPEAAQRAEASERIMNDTNNEETRGTSDDDEEIDVVSDLPDHFKKNRETEMAD